MKEKFSGICELANNEFTTCRQHTDFKWMLNGKNLSFMQMERVDVRTSIAVYKLRGSELYEEFKAYLETLSEIQSIIPIAGHNTQVEQLIDKIIVTSFVMSTGKFDADRMWEYFSSFVEVIAQDTHEFMLVGRLHGVKLAVDEFKIDDEISIVKLSEDEINERQPFASSTSDIPSILDYSYSDAEIRIRRKYRITPHKEHSYFEVTNLANRELEGRLTVVLNAMKFIGQGQYQVFPIKLVNPLYKGGQSSTLSPRYIDKSKIFELNNSNLREVTHIVSLIENSISQDTILERSFSRFLIAVDEPRAEEKIVDLVISLESILLTFAGSAGNSELSYRFSLNGSTLLGLISDSVKFKEAIDFFKNVYSIRSKIVHGDSVDAIIKELKKANCNNLIELNSQISIFYSKILIYLVLIEKVKRPYYVQGGWEMLLRENQFSD